MGNRIIFSSLIFLLIFFVVFYYFSPDTSECGKYDTATLSIASTTVEADLADNDCKRTLGLSGRASLSEGRGMIFKYEGEGSRGIWMKDMKFPIDILWIDEEMRVVGIEWAIAPSTYPKIFGENYKAEYVLELPVGFVIKNKVTLGSIISLKED